MAADRSRLAIAKQDIFSYFEQMKGQALTRADISAVLTKNRASWRLAQRTSTDEFIGFLKDKGSLEETVLHSEEYDKRITRFSWGTVSINNLALSIRKDSYLTHGTAVWLLGLSDLIPKTLYVNSEQSVKPRPSGHLTQTSLATAFSRKQRQSNLVYKHDDFDIVVISGKNTGRLGVERMTDSFGGVVDSTNLERTLIDIIVRPAYAGGVFQLVDIYRRARETISTNRLLATLKKLDYVYPYHQAIGFIMQKAEYPANKYYLFLKLGLNYDFYLAHDMKSPLYDEKWKLFYPQGL